MELTPALAAARRHLGKVADDLEALQLRMRGIQASLPAPVAETDTLRDLDTLDAATEVRTVIDCVLRDWIGPAIGDLRDVLTETEPVEET